jgi:hypothetical protein
MKLVIEIDSYVLEHCKRHVREHYANNIEEAIANGISLQGHGDLISKEQAIELVEFYQLNPQHFSYVNLIDDIKDEKPIIEADRSES